MQLNLIIVFSLIGLKMIFPKLSTFLFGGIIWDLEEKRG